MKSNFPEIKRVCIYGTGGVGGYFGGKIAEVFSNLQFNEYQVYFIARGEHLKAIKQKGIVVKTPERIISAKPTLATDDIRRNSFAGFNFTLCEKLRFKSSCRGNKNCGE